VPGALVAKTGFTDAAQHTYLCATDRHGRRLGVVFLRAQRYPLDQWQQAAELLDWGYALPRGTAVGHLDAPRAPTPSATPRTTAPRTTGPAGPAVAWRSERSSQSNPWPLIGIALAVVTAGGLWIRRRRLTGRG